jgi:hypothetical protein
VVKLKRKKERKKEELNQKRIGTDGSTGTRHDDALKLSSGFCAVSSELGERGRRFPRIERAQPAPAEAERASCLHAAEHKDAST